MTTDCYDDGALRAWLDGEAGELAGAVLSAHLAGCAACRARLDALRARAALAERHLAAPAPPDAPAARARFWAAAVPFESSDEERRTPMYTQPRPLRGARRWYAALAAIAVALALLALPPVRAAADQLVSILRVQNVVFMPVSQERIQQIRQLNSDHENLLIGTPEVVGTPAAERQVASAAEAAAMLDFTPGDIGTLPQNVRPVGYTVRDGETVRATVNVAAARQLLSMLNITDVTLPDALGSAPIEATIGGTLQTRYTSGSATLTLYQGRSPTVKLPDGVDMAQLGKAALRVLGVEPAQADALSRQIDWSSTLLFPIPADVRDIRTVTINGAPGLLVGEQRDGRRGFRLYWQQGGRFYLLDGTGRVNDADLILAAESVRSKQ